MTDAGVLAAAAVGSAALGWMYRRDRLRTAAGRRAAFEACRGLLEGAELRQDGADYPSLVGRREGVGVELRLLADTIELRKLPVLWLVATIRRPLGIGGALDLVMRPRGTEYYSAHHRLTRGLPTPPGWPEEAVLRCDRPQAVEPLLGRLDPHVRAFAADGRGKELLVGPGGVRLVVRVCESERGPYLLTRQPSFADDRLERDRVEAVLALGLGMAADLEGGSRA